MEQMLEKMRKLNWLLQKGGEGNIPFDQLTEILSDLMSSNAYVITDKGKIIGAYYSDAKDTPVRKYNQQGDSYVLPETNDRFMALDETRANITGKEAEEMFPYDETAFGKFMMVVPAYGGGRRLGTVLFARYDQFETDDVILGEYGAVVVGIDIDRRRNRETELMVRKRAMVQLAISTLTSNEIIAMQDVFERMISDEGLVVESKVVEHTGISKTVVSSGLKKLEVAGVIESKALGMKGTHIRVVNDELRTELGRIRY